MFLKYGYPKFCGIIDCANVFIERPKPLSAQAVTWSKYKHHKIFKFWVGITFPELIFFYSSCDKFITRDSGFYDLLERDDEVVAYKSFQIQEDLLFHFRILCKSEKLAKR